MKPLKEDSNFYQKLYLKFAFIKNFKSSRILSNEKTFYKSNSLDF